MGCLPSCFGRRKNRRRQIRRESFQPRLNRISEESTKENHLNLKVHTFNEVPEVAEGFAKEDHSKVQTVEEESKVSEVIAEDVHLNLIFPCVVEVPIISATPITSNHDKVEEKHSPSPTRKRVTFDSNVKTYEHVVVEESVERVEEEVNPEEKSLKSSQGRCSFEGSGITSNSWGTYPSNHRYQNCRESDDEEEDCEESHLEDSEDDDDDGGLLDEDYYCDDTYEDKLHNWDKEVYTEEIADNMLDIESIREKTKGSNASARDRTGYVNAVLNPIENLAQWKAVKSKGGTTNTQTLKENANLISDQEHKQNASFTLEPQVDELPSFVLKPEPRDETKKQRTQDVAVDASLSSWLSTSQTTTSGRSSSVSMSEAGKNENTSRYSKPVQSHDERPILCALTAEEIKQFSATNSPRKSPSRSPESPIIGTVGGYWMATRKFREV